MATKQKTAAKATGSTPSATPTNGGLVFQKLPKGFVLPTVTKASPWEAVVNQLKENEGDAIVVLRLPYDKARKAYTRNKQLQARAKAMGVEKFESAVRKILVDPISGEPLATPEAAIFAGINLPLDEAAE